MPIEQVSGVRLLDLPTFGDETGELIVLEHGQALSYAVKRMFMVRVPEGAVRGRHAHKQCNQLMIAIGGTIDVECDDGDEKRTFVLDSPRLALLVPASIWAVETYRTANAVLAVLCDRGYEAEDYLRRYDEFLAWRRNER